MPAKKNANVPDGPKPKRVMTPEQLEKLAAAREKAKAVKDAMKSLNDDQKLRILQSKMDAINKPKALLVAAREKAKAGKEPPEPIPEQEKEPPEPEQMPEPEAPYSPNHPNPNK